MDISQLTAQARSASRKLAFINSETKNAALQKIADTLLAQKEAIFAANHMDLERSETTGLAVPLRKRLSFGQDKLHQVVDGLVSLMHMPDPVGRTQLATRLDQNLDLYRVSCPIGVIGVIFESRPDALVQISGLCLKSGNAVLLKGGSEAMETNRILAELIAGAGIKAGLPDGWLGLLETRDDVSQLLDRDREVDLLIPRGSNEFVRYIMEHTHIPVLGHADGVCHIYLDKDANPDMALRLTLDSKTQSVAVCNAAETVLIHSALVPDLLRPLADSLQAAGVELFGCDRVCSLLGCKPVGQWHQEYLDYKISLKIVDSLADAITHINTYGSKHTDAIVTANEEAAQQFMLEVDASNVFWNCSTRFSDGFRYGFGAEVGLSTSKLHARGPVGLEGLLTYQYRLLGRGQIVDDYASGRTAFIHEPIDHPYPLSSSGR